jgi:hypothetical protein
VFIEKIGPHPTSVSNYANFPLIRARHTSHIITNY